MSIIQPIIKYHYVSFNIPNEVMVDLGFKMERKLDKSSPNCKKRKMNNIRLWYSEFSVFPDQLLLYLDILSRKLLLWQHDNDDNNDNEKP